MEEPRRAAGLGEVWRSVVVASLVMLLFAALPGDAVAHAIVYEMVPPPLPAAVSERDASVVARVTDGHDQAISGARVIVLTDIDGRIYRAGVGRTDDQGTCRIAALPHGHAWVLADAEGFARASTSLVLVAERKVTLVLGPEHAFEVNVLDAEGKPVVSAEIEVSQADALPRGAHVDASGHAEIGHLGEPPWIVTAHAAGYDETSARDVREGASIKLVLHRLGSILVHVVDAAGTPVPNAKVHIAGTALWPAREGHTGEHGMVKLAGLFQGSYALRATDGTRASPIELGVMLDPGEDKELTLHLAPGRMVVAHVVDGKADDANDVAGARVVVAESNVSPFPLEAVTDKHGRAMLGPIAQGPASLSARADGFVGGQPITVPDVLSGEIRVVLTQAATLTGRVLDDRGYPVAGATLEVIGTDLAGGPVDDEPQRSSFRDREFHATLTPSQLVPAGELGVVPGPVPAIPSAAAMAPTATTGTMAPPGEPWVTSGDGTFHLVPVTPGRLRVLVRHPEYVEAWSDVVTVLPGADANVDVVLHTGGSLEGRVVDVQGHPVGGARIVLAAAHGTLERSTKSATDGTFAFAAVPREVSLDVFTDEEALAPALRSRETIGDGERHEVTLTLPAARDPVLVRVKDDRGYPVASAEVAVASLDAAQPLRETVFTNASGEATLASARGLPLRADVSAPGHAPKQSTIDSAPAELEIAMGRAATVTGTVRSSRGDTLEGAEVSLYVDAGVRHLRTDASGGFLAGDVAPGHARLLVRAAGYATLERSIDIPESDRPLSLGTVDLASEGVVEGEVRDAHGDPVAGARVAKDHVPVMLVRGAQTPDVATTDTQGRFRLGGLEAGALSLEAYAPEVGRGHVDTHVSAGRTTTGVRIVLTPDGGRTSEQPGATVAITLGETGGAAPHDVVVVVVAEGSEAERAGLLAGDVIEAVDGAPVHTIEQAREHLNGPQTADALLDIRRGTTKARLRVPRENVQR